MSPLIRLLLELGPLLIFFGAYIFHDSDIMIATIYLMGFSLLSLGITYYYERKLPKMMLYSTITLLGLGFITIVTKNSSFIKMKPTILYMILSLLLIGGLKYNKIFLKTILGKELSLTDTAWKIFTQRWSYFFILLAVLNELIWRNFPEEFWVKFKVFGIIPIFIVFFLLQLPFINKNKLK